MLQNCPCMAKKMYAYGMNSYFRQSDLKCLMNQVFILNHPQQAITFNLLFKIRINPSILLNTKIANTFCQTSNKQIEQKSSKCDQRIGKYNGYQFGSVLDVLEVECCKVIIPKIFFNRLNAKYEDTFECVVLEINHDYMKNKTWMRIKTFT